MTAEELRRRRDPDATRAEILAAAERLFLQDGFGRTSTSAIARAAGVTKSLIHHHYGSKEALWAEVKRRHFAEYFEIQKRMLEETDDTDADLLRRSLHEYFRFLKRHPDTVRLLSWRFVEETEDPCVDLEDELMRLGEARIRQTQAAGGLRADVEPIFLLKGFLTLAQGWFQSRPMLCHHLAHTVTSIDLDALDEAYLDQITRIYFEGAIPR